MLKKINYSNRIIIILLELEVIAVGIVCERSGQGSSVY